MVLLLRGLPVLIEIGLLVFCLIEVIQTPGDEVRNLPKGVWILLIVFVPIVGCIAWLVAGRPDPRRQSAWRVGNGFPESDRPSRRRVAAPDDDPEFLGVLNRDRDRDGGRDQDREHEELLRKWEADLRNREAELRRDADGDDRREPGAPS